MFLGVFLGGFSFFFWGGGSCFFFLETRKVVFLFLSCFFFLSSCESRQVGVLVLVDSNGTGCLWSGLGV